MRRIPILLAFIALLFCGCKSWGKFWALNILSISPADGSTSNATQSVVRLTFDQAIRESSLLINKTSQACSGNIQLSVNNFVSCIRLKSATLSDGGKTLTITGYGFPNGQTAKTKVTTTLESENGSTLVSEYISTGFGTIPGPCGGNCFQNLGSITTAPNAGVHIFLIESGLHAGKMLYVPGSSTSSHLLDTNTLTFSAGPDLTPCGTNNTSSQTIALRTGPHAGKYLFFRANNSTATCLYNPETNSFTANTPASLPGANFGSGMHIFEITSGTHAGKFFILSGNTGTASAVYNPVTNAFSDGPNLATSPNAATTSLAITSGTNSGKFIVFFGNGTTDTGLFNPETLSFSTLVAMPFATMQGYSVQMLTSGRGIVFHANNQPNASFYNPDTNSFSSTLSSVNNIESGSFSYLISYGNNAGKIILSAGNNFPNTELYTPGVGTTAGPNVPFNMNNGSIAFPVETGIYPQTWIVTNALSYAIYFP